MGILDTLRELLGAFEGSAGFSGTSTELRYMLCIMNGSCIFYEPTNSDPNALLAENIKGGPRDETHSEHHNFPYPSSNHITTYKPETRLVLLRGHDCNLFLALRKSKSRKAMSWIDVVTFFVFM